MNQMQAPSASSSPVISAHAMDDVIDLKELWQVLLRYRWKIAGFTFAVTLAAVLIAFSLTPIYQATSTLLIQQEETKVISIDDLYGVDGQGDSYLNTQYEVLKSRALSEKIVKKLNLVNNPEFNSSLRPKPWYSGLLDWRSWFGMQLPSVDEEEMQQLIFKRTVDAFASNLSIEPVKKTQIVKVNFTSESPKLAAAVANAIAEGYIENYLESKLEMTTSANAWMHKQMESLGAKLKTAEQKLQIFREQENLVDLEGVMTLTSKELQAITESYIQARQKLSQVQSVYEQVSKISGGDFKSYYNLPAVLSHPLVQKLKEQQSVAQTKVEELKKRYGPKHPKMIAAVSELDSYEESIRQQVMNIVNGVEKEYEAEKAHEQMLATQLEVAKRNAQDINRKQFKLRELERDVSANKDLYDTFFKRLQETGATSDMNSVNARIVDKAFIPERPVKPKKSLIVLLAAMLGFIASSGMAFMLEMMSNTIRSMRDVEEKLNLPVLGILPKVEKTRETIIDSQKDKSKKEADIDIFKLYASEHHRLYSEAVRTVRTALTLTALDRPRKTYMVTSTAPGEGKSSLSIAIAIAMSQLGKTIVVGADLRRPGLVKKFGFKPGLPGLSNVLAGGFSLQEVIQPTGSLDVLIAGVIPPNPQELLASQRFVEVLEELEKNYDTVIVDCPPVQSVADGLMISKHCDGVIFTIESDRVAVPTIQHAVGRLLKAGAPVLGVVVNKVKTNQVGYGYDSYNYGYYQYEYGSEK